MKEAMKPPRRRLDRLTWGFTSPPPQLQICRVTPVETPAAISTQQRLERLVVTASALIAEVSMEGVLKRVVRWRRR